MRSSKSRSRGNKNRNTRPSGGNIINRVFDSSGPEGKVRGTPQQIIEKYNQLHRDAQLSNDLVAAENFAQHAEHYTRMLAEAQREVDRAREDMEAQNRERQAERDRERAARLKAQEEAGNAAAPGASDDDQPAAEEPAQARTPVRPAAQERPQEQTRDRPRERTRQPDLPAFITGGDPEPETDRDTGLIEEGDLAGDPGLVETPEQGALPEKKPRTSRPRKPRARRPAEGDEAGSDSSSDKPAAAAE